jgi:endonuclease/exonuclease/phosphatase family metal-dependent hydrolase
VGTAAVTAVSVHLSLTPEERLAHTEHVLQALEGRTPLVVAGDLNEGPAGAAWQRLEAAGRLRAVSPTRPTYPAHAPRRRLDVVFASAGLRVLPHREVLVPESAYAAASDHRPTWVDLEVAGSA